MLLDRPKYAGCLGGADRAGALNLVTDMKTLDIHELHAVTLVGGAARSGPQVPISVVRVTKTFLLGTGCQKGGTTWLFQYLKQSPEYVAGFRKEYHVFDALDVPDMAYRREQLIQQAEEALARGRDGGPINAQVMMLAAMQANPVFYYDYFAGLLMTRPRGRMTADVTPSYGMLPAARLAEIRDELAVRGVRTVALFLMRDPVDRILSQIRMQVRETPERFAKPPHELLLGRHWHPQYELRTRYDRTIAALDEVFERTDIIYGFFENLFSEARIREVCTTLGIDFHPPRFDERHNASPPAQAVPDETVRVVATHYREVYETVAARFPGVDLEAVWPSMRFLR
jgi:hypothetical protein